MFARNALLIIAGVLALAVSLVAACSGSAATGTAAASDPFWMQNIAHQGKAPTNANPSSYVVFRNVKDYGAKGDGVTDDTAAINSAISSGGRCGGGSCGSSTTSPAVVYFPQGTYLVSAPIIAYYYTQLIGDGRKPPTLLASAGFTGIAVIDADPYEAGGANWYTNQDNFFRSVRNFVIDLRQMPTTSGTGLHWQVSQSTSLINIVVQMSTAAGNSQQGIFMENGSGGFMGDLVFNGGKYGVWVGNQQFTVRNITVNNAATAIYSLWNWGWTFQGVTINNCQVGFDLATGGLTQNTQSVGAVAIIDATIINTPVGVRSSTASGGSLHGSLVLNNVALKNVPTAVGLTSGAVVLAGGTTTITSWVQGNVYKGTSAAGSFVQAATTPPTKASSLLGSNGQIFGRTHPQYADYAVGQFVSIKSLGAKGDGVTDDTTVIQNALNTYAGCSILYFDHGNYYVTKTITVPPGSRLVGEAWSVILAGGSAFSSQTSPQPVFQVGAAGSSGVVEITDMIFATKGPAPGAIIIEWNIHGTAAGSAGMWDSHIILGGATGTNLQASQCPTGSNNAACQSAFLGLHLTSAATAYLEGLWVWNADHDLDTPASTQVSLFSGRGILSQSAGPVWLIGTAEHHVLYQYNLQGASNHYMGLIQTETPYFQPSPAAPAPYAVNSAYADPVTSQSSAWGLWVQSSTNILVFGAGHYSFFQNYAQTCLTSVNCQSQIVNIDSTSTIAIYSLSTVGVTSQLSINQSPVISQASNQDGFQETVTAWTRS